LSFVNKQTGNLKATLPEARKLCDKRDMDVISLEDALQSDYVMDLLDGLGF
jgi:hypothetical protein